MINTLKKTNEILKKYNITANKRYGQNFLIDDNVLESIVEKANINENDLVIEIGPGLGNLTEYILDRAKFTILIEIDNNMINILNDRFSRKNNYMLLNEDVMKINIDEVIKKLEFEKNINFENVKVVANLPYYITTPILFKLLQDESRIKEITVMVQKEVAKRMESAPKSKEYGILSIMTQYLGIPNIVINVSNSCFIPAPNVDSAVIKIIKEKRFFVSNEELFFKLVHASFSMRRKKMINSLYNNNFLDLKKEEIEKIFNDLNLSINSRAEELNIFDYIKITEYLDKKLK